MYGLTDNLCELMIITGRDCGGPRGSKEKSKGQRLLVLKSVDDIFGSFFSLVKN